MQTIYLCNKLYTILIFQPITKTQSQNSFNIKEDKQPNTTRRQLSPDNGLYYNIV